VKWWDLAVGMAGDERGGRGGSAGSVSYSVVDC
jgi:hypothetical protein